MSGYTKLFSTIVTSTIWREPKETKVLWITMLALATKDGVVEGSVPGIAHLAGLTMREAEIALATLAAPDPYSRTKEHEGRRIEVIDGGWRLINHAKYRALLSKDERREYLRKKQQEHRSRKQMSTLSTNVTPLSTPSTKAEADTKAKAEESNTSHTPSAKASARGDAESIYGLYPRKVARQDALKAISAALKTRTAEFLSERTRAYHDATMLWPTEDRRFIPYPASWFRDGRYDDDPQTWQRQGTNGHKSKEQAQAEYDAQCERLGIAKEDRI